MLSLLRHFVRCEAPANPRLPLEERDRFMQYLAYCRSLVVTHEAKQQRDERILDLCNLAVQDQERVVRDTQSSVD